MPNVELKMKAGYKTPRLELQALRRRKHSLEKTIVALNFEVVLHPEVMHTLYHMLKLLAECKETIARFLDIHTQLT